MKIIVARTAGFCMGVRRAVDMVLDAANQTDEPVCTYGPLIHNPQVLEMLENKGIHQLDHIPEAGKGIVLIRAHGVPPSDEKALEAIGFSVVNATCPRVTRVQNIIEKHASKGYATIIVGDKNHPEVVGLLGYTKDMGTTVSSLEQLMELSVFEQAVVVAQTTQNKAVYDQIKEWCSIHAPHYKLFDTICGSTRKRQTEILDLAWKNDAVIVVGGKESGNTRRLAQVAGQADTPAFLIEDAGELDFSKLQSASSIAITAGASTPNWMILDTLARVKDGLASRHPLLRFFHLLSGLLLKANVLLAAGGASLTYGCCRILGIDAPEMFSLVSMLYILSMQIWNHIFIIASDRYNQPERAHFYTRYKVPLGLFASVSGGGALFLAHGQGLLYFVTVLVMMGLGLSYNYAGLPDFLVRGAKKGRIKDIPGSKAFLMAAAWALITSVIPAGAAGSSLMTALPCFCYVAGIVFVRTVFFDALAIQGDRISGNETLPIFLGEKKSFRLMEKVLLAEILLPPVLAVIGLVPLAACGAMAAVPCCMFCLIRVFVRKNLLSGKLCEFLMDGSFLVMGLLMILVK